MSTNTRLKKLERQNGTTRNVIADNPDGKPGLSKPLTAEEWLERYGAQEQEADQ